MIPGPQDRNPPAAPPVMMFVILTAAALLAAASPANAHADIALADEAHVIPAGGALDFGTTLHYHRVVGTVQVTETGAAALTVVAIHNETGARQVIAGPGGDLRFNALVRCCDDASWAPYTIRLENPGPSAVEATARITLVHDGLGVLVDDAETGAASTAFLVFGVIMAAVAIRIYLADAKPNGGERRTRIAAGLLLASWLVSLPMSIWGMTRYGGGVNAAIAGATADLPPMDHPIVTVHVILLVGLIALWSAATLTWASATRRLDAHPRRLALVAFAAAASAAIATLDLGLEYRSVAVPGFLALLTVPLPAWHGARLWVQPPPTTTGGPDPRPSKP